MTGMVLLLCFGWTVLLCLSVQAYENLALHQPAWQSSTARPYTADLAVDGYTGQCAVSFSGQTAEWRVDLGGEKNIHQRTTMLEHRSKGFLSSDPDEKSLSRLLTANADRIRSFVYVNVVDFLYHCSFNKDWDPGYYLGFSVYISNTTDKEDGVMCFRDTNYTRATIPNPVNITCPYYGRYVIYYNNRRNPPYPDDYSSNTDIGLCEVEVYDCPSPGYYGDNCSLDCPQNCQDGYCDSVEGTCLACKPGFIGPRCDMECAVGLFGNNCSKNCSLTCVNPGVCHTVTGHCNGSCLAGWEGDMCENECSIGLYGVNCLQNCSMACGIPGHCDRITGYCNGGCQLGWTGVKCEEECAVGLFGNNCSKNCSLTCANPGSVQ
ncbi:uncharacterized protein LOC144624460 [Crassostrea virginica]